MIQWEVFITKPLELVEVERDDQARTVNVTVQTNDDVGESDDQKEQQE